MGVIKHFSSGSNSNNGNSRCIRLASSGITKETVNNNNTNIVYVDRFKIMATHQEGKNIAVLIKYPDNTNYNGNKIVVFKNKTKEQVSKMKEIDPHFLPDNNIIARFEPTNEGWELAIKFLKLITK